MAFDSWAAFFQMGRHGLYVWSAYGLSILVIVGVVVMSLWRFRLWKQKIQRQIARQQRHDQLEQNKTNNTSTL